MKRNKTLAAAVAVVAGGVISYFVRRMIRERRAKMNAVPDGHHPERHLTTVFSRAKQFKGPAVSNN